MSSQLSVFPDFAWSWALSVMACDLDPADCAVLTQSDDALLAFSADKYRGLRAQGLFRRESTAENSRIWSAVAAQAFCSATAASSRSALLSFAPAGDPSVFSLHAETLKDLLALALLVRKTSFGCIYNAVINGYYNQPDGSLDALFARLDEEYGAMRWYFAMFAFFEIGHRFLTLHFSNGTQARVAMLKIKQVSEGKAASPRIIVAAAWAYRCLTDLIQRHQGKQTSQIPPLVRALLAAE